MSPQTYDTILFDLDGTLTDSQTGIIKSIQYALKKSGMQEEKTEKLLEFIGPPLILSFKKHYAFDDQTAQKALTYYREYFSETGIFENFLYDGISDLLKALKDAHKKLILATSKPTVFAERILEHFHIDHYFDIITGSNLDGTRIAKHEVIGYILTNLEAKEKEKTVMVGDRAFDVIGAREHGIDSIAVRYGYGTEQELRESNPTFIAETVNELKKILMNIE